MPQANDPERIFSADVTVEGVFHALPVLLSLAAVVWAVMSDDPWWSRLLAPAFAFIGGCFASLILVGVGVILEDHFPFWKRSFWRTSR